MSWPRRLLLASAGVVTLFASWATSWLVLPFPRECGITPCDTGAANILGSGNYTWPQTVLILVGISAGVFLVGLAAMPSRPHIAVAAAVFVTALVVAVVLPKATPQVGSFGYPPTDRRLELRAAIVITGVIAAVAVALAGEPRGWRRRCSGA
jgi:hypothetical protein